MWRRPVFVIVVDVPEPPTPTTRVVIELSGSGDPISGTLHTTDRDCEFLGWLQLINALEDARGASPRAFSAADGPQA
jgi:hypothetical protein